MRPCPERRAVAFQRFASHPVSPRPARRKQGDATMDCFSKNFPTLESLSAEDQWAVAQGENNGNPMIVRVNSSAKDYAGHPELPIRLGIAVPLNAPNEHGFPGEAEAQQLGDIEDRLFDTIGSLGRVVLIITTSGMREFVSYVRAADVA